jgi:hypothetical protein
LPTNSKGHDNPEERPPSEPNRLLQVVGTGIAVLFTLALVGRIVGFYRSGGGDLLQEATSDRSYGAYLALILAGVGVRQLGDRGKFREANPYIAWGLGIVAALLILLVAVNPRLRCALSGGEWIRFAQRCLY